MFDIKKAVKDSFSEFKDAGQRTHLMRFIARVGLNRGLTTQWRSVGNEWEIVDHFLSNLGFNSGDYEVYTSVLDDSVKDFRWVPGGKYFQFAASFAPSVTDVNIISPVNMILCGIASGRLDEQLLDSLPTVEAVDLSSGGEAVTAKFRVEEITTRRIAQFAEFAETSADESIKTLAETLRNSDSAVLNLGAIERISRALGLVPSDQPCLFGCASGVSEQHKTIIRHLTSSTRLPATEVFASTIPSFDYDYAVRTSASTDPLTGFFYRDKTTAARAAIGSPMFMSAFEELNPECPGTSFVRAANLTTFWEYVRTLYSKFFMTNVFIHFASRVVVSPQFQAWTASAPNRYPDSPFIVALRENGFVSDRSNFGVSIIAVMGDKVRSGARENPIAYLPLSVGGSFGSDNPFEATHVPTGCLAAEWFSLVHTGFSEITTAAPTNQGWVRWGASDYSFNLAKLKARTATPMLTNTVTRLTNVANNPCFEYDARMAMIRHCHSSPTASLVAGVGAAFRMYYGNPEDQGTIEFTTATWKDDPKDKFDGVHSDSTVVAAVYSGIPAEGSYFSKLCECESDPEKFTAFIKELPGHQRDPITKDPGVRSIIFETNLVLNGDCHKEQLEAAIARLVAANLVAHRGNVDLITGRTSDYDLSRSFPDVRLFADDTIADSLNTDTVNTAHIVSALKRVFPDSPTIANRASLPNTFNVETHDGVEVRVATDIQGRGYAVVDIFGLAAIMMLAQNRLAAGIRPFDANVMINTPCSTVIVPEDEGSDADRQLDIATKAVTQVMRDDRATDFGGLEVHRRPYGIGPFARNLRPTAARGPAHPTYMEYGESNVLFFGRDVIDWTP